MGALLGHQAHAPVGIAEGDEVLAQQPHPHGVAIGLRHLLDEAGGQPVATHHLAHGRIALDAAQQVIFFWGQHGVLPMDNLAI